MATSESNGDATGTTSGDTIEELTKEVENLKKKLEEERAKFNDVECNNFIKKICLFKLNLIINYVF